VYVAGKVKINDILSSCFDLIYVLGCLQKINICVFLVSFNILGSCHVIDRLCCLIIRIPEF
jgi:hypothetical protein